jgi:NAD(P)-dependent dehydrogenase (short-subunit alcohol dehydrogenase family)
MRFENKCVIVTGAGGGIGRATALMFAAEGAWVVGADRSESVDETAQIIRTRGGTALAMQVDTGSEAGVLGLMGQAAELYGGVDVIFANAGISGGFGGMFEQTADDWAEILRINLIGSFLAIKHGAPLMIARGGGSIICTASVAGLRSGAGGPAYSASKAAVINLVQIAAQQLSGTHVRVNAVCPGLIETAMTASIYERARAVGKEARLGHLNPLRRGGQPEEIASAVLFLASSEASYINGHALIIDGGLSSSHPINRQEIGKTAV